MKLDWRAINPVPERTGGSDFEGERVTGPRKRGHSGRKWTKVLINNKLLWSQLRPTKMLPQKLTVREFSRN